MTPPRISWIPLVLLLLSVGALAVGQAARSQDPATAGPKVEPEGESETEKRQRLLEELAAGKTRLPDRAPRGGVDDPMLPEAPRPTALEGVTREKYEEALREYYDYTISGLRHRSRVFEWQLFSARLIFVVVLALVVAGIYFAAVQFHVGLREPAAPAGEEAKPTTFKASASGLEVSSPVLGVVILVISLAFFYLYLVYVYPIENIF